MSSSTIVYALSVTGFLLGNSVAADTHSQSTYEYQACIIEHMNSAEPEQRVNDIKQRCTKPSETPSTEALSSEGAERSLGLASQRLLNERQTEYNPFVLTPHRINYFLPVLYSSNINRDEYEHLAGFPEHLDNIESKFQLSLKVPLNNSSLLVNGDGFYVAFTIEAWWQMYAGAISRPFRETNYRPEGFYLLPLNWNPLGGNTGLMIGMEHQSNGRSESLSRSWNRVYVNWLYERDQFALSLKPWWRISEDPKEYPNAPNGDDNPDIAEYMGHMQAQGVYQWSHYELSVSARRSFSSQKGSLELGLTFPLWGKLRGYATFFNGYGESMIDYNHKQTRVGLGIALNNFL